jgi:hypothetical protein
MDSELFGGESSLLAQTFEWMSPESSVQPDTNGDNLNQRNGKDIDVDMTVMKNLVEAQAQAMGSPMAGPLGQLMAQLGIQLPVPPPMSNKK